MNKNNKYWYALYTKVNQEFKASEYLSKNNIEYYLPVVDKIKQWSDRKKRVKEPVLKNYIFIYATESQRQEALLLPQIVRCVFENGKPAVIPDWQIENFRKAVEANQDFIVYNGLVPGQKIEILSGPFKGVKGVIQTKSKNLTLAVSIELLNRSLIIELPSDVEIKKCPDTLEHK